MSNFNNIFSDFWINIIILFVFVIFVTKLGIDECKKRNLFENYKFKIKDFYEYIFAILLFCVGICLITLLLSNVEKLVNGLWFVLIKLSLYLGWAFLSSIVLLKTFKKVKRNR